MSDQHKGKSNARSRSVAREKSLPVAEASQQSKAPGAVAPSAPNSQSWTPNSEQAYAGNAQSGALGAQQQTVGGNPDRGRGVASGSGGWSARQKAHRIQARAEEDRLGMSQQSGSGGLEQDQRAGSQESASGPAASKQTGVSGSQSGGQPNEASSDYGKGKR